MKEGMAVTTRGIARSTVPRPPSALATVLAPALLAGVLFASPTASASRHHAHHHYDIGIRAYVGTRLAATLYQEAADETLDLTLAREDAATMAEMASQVSDRVKRLTGVFQVYERELLGEAMETMAASAGEARDLAKELEASIAAEGDGPASSELRDFVRDRSRLLYWKFDAILTLHKKAEKALGITVPPAPPAP